MLGSFKRMQGYAETDFPGSRIEQAYLILSQPEWRVRRAIAEANGFPIDDRPLSPGSTMVILDDVPDHNDGMDEDS